MSSKHQISCPPSQKITSSASAVYAYFSSTRMVMRTLRHTVATTSAGEGIKPFSLLGQGHSCKWVN